jgi:hypothetical protein
MILLGCLLAFGIAFLPRIMLILAWIFSERWDIVWKGNWFVPLLGIIFAPYTTVMYMLAWNPVSGITGFDWFWVALGVLLDVMKWAEIYHNRKGIPGYPQGPESRYASDVTYNAGNPTAPPPTQPPSAD